MRKYISILVAAALACGCSDHFIKDSGSRRIVQEDLQGRSELLCAAGIDLESMDCSTKEKEALEFLYAYMSLGDLMNMSPDYYLECVRSTFKAVDEMSWGRSIPQRELRHFVLPPRVNNENLDGCRPVFYEELAPRVKGLTMAEAVLEVNHWCHEKATYKPSDSRTSSPLATLLTAYGRCGEESTLLVAALRSVGIPARQVYTPRWAHTDDNHAWVEAWVDGQWHFLGACEPEPVLDLGWFNAPASRGMLMSTNVFGHYDGPEEKLEQTPLYTRINVIGNYAADASRLEVSVTDTDGNAVTDATVDFGLYNYAEFYPVASLPVDGKGRTGLTAGCGDLLVIARDADGRFGFTKATVGTDKEVSVCLAYDADSSIDHVSLKIVPPSEHPNMPEVSEQQRSFCNSRLADEDAIREAYIAGFPKIEDAQSFADSIGIDRAKTAEAVLSSRGNHAQIMRFLAEAAAAGRSTDALRMLGLVSEKDLRDTPADTLLSHLLSCEEGAADNILNPRVYTELLTCWRSGLQQKLSAELKTQIKENPELLVRWCCDSLVMYPGINSSYTPSRPVRVLETRACDAVSRDLFFVAACRACGVPAWKDNVTGSVRYEKDGRSYDVDFGSSVQSETAMGKLLLRYSPIPALDDPKYYTHFSLCRYEGGRFHQLEYDEGESLSSLFSKPADVEPGMYMMVSGTRMAGGEVNADIEFLRVREDHTTEAELILREDPEQLRVIGSFNSEALYEVPGKGSSSVLATTGRGYFAVLLVDGGGEPTTHALNDICAAKESLESWGRSVLVIFASEADRARFHSENYNFPSTVTFGVDSDGSMKKMIEEEMKLDAKAQLPYVLVADTFNRVVFFTNGYSIGLDDKLAKTFAKL